MARLLIEDITLLYGDVITLRLRCRGGAEKTLTTRKPQLSKSVLQFRATLSYLHSHREWLSSHPRRPAFPFACALPAHAQKFSGWAPLKVKLRLPPLQNWGNSQLY